MNRSASSTGISKILKKKTKTFLTYLFFLRFFSTIVRLGLFCLDNFFINIVNIPYSLSTGISKLQKCQVSIHFL